ncbi:HK97 family phage prohead protease [Aurantimonas sp. A2-1-M11]|uniref:HK97 family phage prohead protease n=1 Tax=Aurantimonas sp. A2-1-M11 TaxID=3113712 RepID=UPI002F9431AC
MHSAVLMRHNPRNTGVSVLTLSQLSLRKSHDRSRPSAGETRLRATSSRPKTYDVATRTFEFVIASETPCRARRRGQWIDEVLPMSALKSIRQVKGIKILDNHSNWSLRNVLGVVEDAWIEGKNLVGRGRLSDRPDIAGIVRDVETGILDAWSVGCFLTKEGTLVERAGKVPLYTVGEWQPFEVSAVVIGADPTARTRGARSTALQLNNKTRSQDMDPETFRTRMAELFAGLTDEIVGLLGGEGDDASQHDPAPADAPQVSAAKRTAKLRQIGDICRKRGFEAEFKALETADASLDKFQDLLIASLRTSDTEISSTAKPATATRGKLISFSESSTGKAGK